MKHLLLEIEVSDKGQQDAESVAFRIEDALFGHINSCTDGEYERSLFTSNVPRIRLLTEENPI